MKKMILLLVFLVGCTHHYYHEVTTVTANVYQANLIAEKLAQYKISVTEKQLVIPSALLFRKDTVNFTPQAYGVLDKVVAYLEQFELETVQVAGYANLEPALLAARAQRIVRFLWQQEINASLCYTDTSWHNTMLQDCIVISFQKA